MYATSACERCVGSGRGPDSRRRSVAGESYATLVLGRGPSPVLNFIPRIVSVESRGS